MRLLPLFALLCSAAAMADEAGEIEVYRDASCGCCTAWISHLQDNGFTVRDRVVDDMPALKTRLGVPPRLGSCHTAVIDGKFVEGHVPATDILKLRARPDLLGAAVPGMPLGSPGMEHGNHQDAYQVIGLGADGQERVLSSYPDNR
jgi:hypothetical protein